MNIKTSKNGQGLVEYALMMAFVVVLVAAILNFTGVRIGLEAIFDSVGTFLMSVLE